MSGVFQTKGPSFALNIRDDEMHKR